MKKFEPHYRLVRYGAASKIEKASRQQRTYNPLYKMRWEVVFSDGAWWSTLFADCVGMDRQATQEPSQDCTGDGQGESGGIEGQEEVRDVECVLARTGPEEVGEACLCVPTSCSRIMWRIGNTRCSSYLLMIPGARLLECVH